MSTSIEELVSQSEVIVIANSSMTFRQVPQLLQAEHTLIDLVGITRGDDILQGSYEGIGW
jgi:hypothetical protein